MSKRPGLSRFSLGKRHKNSGGLTQSSLQSTIPSSPPLIEENDNINPSQDKFPAKSATVQKNVTTQKSNAKVTTQVAAAKSYFVTVLQKNGVIFNDDDEVFSTKIASKAFVKDLKKYFVEHVDYPYNIEDFVSAFEKYISDKKAFKKLLTGSILLPEENTSQLEHVQIGIIQMLLKIDLLQTKIINILMDELTKYVLQDNLSDEIVWIRHILGQLRVTDFYVDGEALVKTLIMLIEISKRNKLAQHELICCFPRIALDAQHDLIAVELSRILANDFSLTDVILDTLGCLCISKSVRQQIHLQVLDLLKSIVPMEKMHSLTQYLLSTHLEENSFHVIEQLRVNLDWGTLIPSLKEDRMMQERASSQVLTFEIIRNSLASSPHLFDVWLKLLLSIQSEKDYKPLDLLTYFILCICAYKRKRYIEKIICKRINEGWFSQQLVESTFKDFYPVIRDNFKKIVDLFEFFVKNKLKKDVIDFGSLCYKLFIIHEYEFNKSEKTSSYITRALITDVVNHAHQLNESGISAQSVLSELCKSNSLLLRDNAVQLMRLLHLIDRLSLTRARIVMDILCCIAYPVPRQITELSLQSDIEMYIPKKLCTHKILDMKKGIVSSVIAFRYMSRNIQNNEENISSNSSIDSICELPSGGPKEAATLIESMFIATKEYPQLQGMSYDELSASIWIHRDTIDKQIIIWLCEAVTQDFQQCYISETADDEIENCKVEQQYLLNPVNEEQISTIMNIADLTLKSNQTSSNLVIMPPLFRLMAILHYIRFDHLTSINAVLGCAVTMPVIEDDDNLEDFSYEQRKLVLDCIFHCINWFREVINAFIKVDEEDVKSKILSRMETLVKLEKRYFKLLSIIDADYRPPMANFHREQVIEISKYRKTLKKVKIKTKSKTLVCDNNETNMIQATVGRSQPVDKITHSNKLIDDAVLIFRVFDNDVMILLSKTVTLDEEDGCISMTGVIYLLQDIAAKFEIFNEIKKQEYPPQIAQMSPVKLVEDVKYIIPHMMRHLKVVSNVLKEALKECDDIVDAHVMYFEKSMEAKTCLTLILKIFSEILGWSDLRNPVHKDLLRDVLMGISATNDSTNSIKKLAMLTVAVISEYKDVILTLPCAAHFAKLLLLLIDIIDDADYEIKLRNICTELLSTEWYDNSGSAEKGRQCNLYLDSLLEYYFYKSDLKFIVRTVNWIKEEVSMIKTVKGSLKTFPNFCKSNFTLLFRRLFAAFVLSVQKRIQKPLSSTQHLRFWEAIMNTLGKLMAIVKEQDTKTNMSSFLKQSYIILKLFSIRGLQGLEACLRSNTEDVITILKTMQQSTRFINTICVEAKMTKDMVLLASVPKILMVLESLIYKVKAALVANNCSTAFMMGNLINRNIQGDIIPTQSSRVTETNSDDELPSDDNESEIDSELDEDNVNSKSKLY